MIIIVDERETVAHAYEASFEREGLSAAGFDPLDFVQWLRSSSNQDIKAVEAFLLGDCSDRESHPRAIRRHSRAPIIALSENPALELTLRLFASGVDDVVRKPIHVKEIVARVGAIKRRQTVEDEETSAIGELKVYFDGRDPEVNGRTLVLPRRERRILELLAANTHRRVSKAQIFSSIYGLFDAEVEESVVESHICKLRKKLKRCLGYDPIDSKRYLGYQLNRSQVVAAPTAHAAERAPALAGFEAAL